MVHQRRPRQSADLLQPDRPQRRAELRRTVRPPEGFRHARDASTPRRAAHGTRHLPGRAHCREGIHQRPADHGTARRAGGGAESRGDRAARRTRRKGPGRDPGNARRAEPAEGRPHQSQVERGPAEGRPAGRADGGVRSRRAPVRLGHRSRHVQGRDRRAVSDHGAHAVRGPCGPGCAGRGARADAVRQLAADQPARPTRVRTCARADRALRPPARGHDQFADRARVQHREGHRRRRDPSAADRVAARLPLRAGR